MYDPQQWYFSREVPSEIVALHGVEGSHETFPQKPPICIYAVAELPNEDEEDKAIQG